MRLEIEVPDLVTAMAFTKMPSPGGVHIECKGSVAASADAGFHIVTVLIDFTSQVGAAVLAAWILRCFEKAHVRKTRINRRQTTLKLEDIERSIQRTIAASSTSASAAVRTTKKKRARNRI
jgi:hypothetical protein